MKFKFKAIKKDSGVYSDVRDSQDKYTLYEELKEEGDTLLSAIEFKKSRFQIDIPFLSHVPDHQKIIFSKNLGSMINAGLSLSKALNILEKQIANKNFKKIIISLEDEIKKGNTLSGACGQYPDVFPKLFISMVRAGEESGKLSESLQLIASQMEGTYKLKKKIQGAMIYPSVIISIMLIIGFLMMVLVVPSITATFKDLNIELPLLTRILINTSDFLKNNVILTIVSVLVLVGGLYSFSLSKIGKKMFDYGVLRLPVIGEIVKETNSARIARTISSLLASGVPYAEAISIARDVVQNSFYKQILDSAILAVEKGEAISTIFLENTKLTPVFVGEMTVVGEETGRLPAMFMEVALFYEDSVDQSTKNISTIIEPVLMVVIGVGVGFFALAMIKPIYSLTDSIQ